MAIFIYASFRIDPPREGAWIIDLYTRTTTKEFREERFEEERRSSRGVRATRRTKILRPGPRGSPVETFTHTERERERSTRWDCDKSKVQGGNSHGAWKKRENASRRKGHALLWLRMIICPPIRTVCEEISSSPPACVHEFLLSLDTFDRG